MLIIINILSIIISIVLLTIVVHLRLRLRQSRYLNHQLMVMLERYNYDEETRTRM